MPLPPVQLGAGAHGPFVEEVDAHARQRHPRQGIQEGGQGAEGVDEGVVNDPLHPGPDGLRQEERYQTPNSRAAPMKSARKPSSQNFHQSFFSTALFRYASGLPG